MPFSDNSPSLKRHGHDLQIRFASAFQPPRDNDVAEAQDGSNRRISLNMSWTWAVLAMEPAMKRADLTEKILDIKREKGLSWKHICEAIGGMSPTLITGALLGP